MRKFYDMAASDTEQVAAPEPSPTSNIAAIMAKEGVKSSGTESDAAPVVLRNQSTEAKAVSPVEPAKEKAVANDDKPVSQEEADVPQQQTAEELLADWKDAIKDREPEEVLEALGFDKSALDILKEFSELDPKVLGFIKTWKDSGDVKGYLDEVAKDYSKMPAEDVMRHQLRLEYPKASEAQLDILYKKEVVDKYNLNSYDEEEQNEGRLLLEAKAEKFRDVLVQAQQEKLLPNAPDRSAEQGAEEQKLAEFSQTIVREFNEDPYTKEVLTKNAITIGEGNDKFVFPVDSKAVTELVLNGDTTGELMFEKVKRNGEETFVPKSKHQLLVATVNKYGEKFITELAKHYKSLGSKAAIEPIDNARPMESRNASASDEAPKTLAEAMAKFGKLNSGGW
jgi:hypothetical protein